METHSHPLRVRKPVIVQLNGLKSSNQITVIHWATLKVEEACTNVLVVRGTSNGDSSCLYYGGEGDLNLRRKRIQVTCAIWYPGWIWDVATLEFFVDSLFPRDKSCVCVQVCSVCPLQTRLLSSHRISTYLHAEKQQRQFAGVVVGTGHKRSDRLFVIISGFVCFTIRTIKHQQHLEYIHKKYEDQWRILRKW